MRRILITVISCILSLHAAPSKAQPGSANDAAAIASPPIFVCYGLLTRIRRCLFEAARFEEIIKAKELEMGARLLHAFIDANYKPSAAEGVGFLCVQPDKAFFQLARARDTSISEVPWDAAQRRAVMEFLRWYQVNWDKFSQVTRQMASVPLSQGWSSLKELAKNPLITQEDLLDAQVAFVNAADAHGDQVREIEKQEPAAATEIKSLIGAQSEIRWYQVKAAKLRPLGKDLSKQELDYLAHKVPQDWAVDVGAIVKRP